MRILTIAVVLVLSSALLYGAASSAKKTGSKSTHPSSHKSTSSHASTSHKPSSSSTKSGKSSAHKGTKAATHSTSKSASRKGGKHGKKPVASQPRQQVPSADRYKEIQRALADRGYFNGSVDGNWNQDSVDAMKRFQKDQNLTSDGKISSLALIGLGLGPKHEPIGAIAAKPASDPTPNP